MAKKCLKTVAPYFAIYLRLRDRLLIDMVFVCLMSSCVQVFVLKWILVKTISRKFQLPYAKRVGDSAKDRYSLRFHDGS